VNISDIQDPPLKLDPHYHVLISEEGALFPTANYIFDEGRESVKFYLDFITGIFPNNVQTVGRAQTEASMYNFAEEDQDGDGVLFKRGNLIIAWVLCEICVPYSLQ